MKRPCPNDDCGATLTPTATRDFFICPKCGPVRIQVGPAAVEDRAPYQKHSTTSRAAAAEIEPTAGTLRAKVLAYIRERGERGATDREIQEALEMQGSTQRPRRVKLVELGLVRDSGEVRLTESGRKSVVWVAT